MAGAARGHKRRRVSCCYTARAIADTASSAILLAVEQRIGSINPSVHAAGIDPAFVPGLTPPRPDDASDDAAEPAEAPEAPDEAASADADAPGDAASPEAPPSRRRPASEIRGLGRHGGRRRHGRRGGGRARRTRLRGLRPPRLDHHRPRRRPLHPRRGGGGLPLGRDRRGRDRHAPVRPPVHRDRLHDRAPLVRVPGRGSLARHAQGVGDANWTPSSTRTSRTPTTPTQPRTRAPTPMPMPTRRPPTRRRTRQRRTRQRTRNRTRKLRPRTRRRSRTRTPTARPRRRRPTRSSRSARPPGDRPRPPSRAPSHRKGALHRSAGDCAGSPRRAGASTTAANRRDGRAAPRRDRTEAGPARTPPCASPARATASPGPVRPRSRAPPGPRAPPRSATHSLPSCRLLVSCTASSVPPFSRATTSTGRSLPRPSLLLVRHPGPHDLAGVRVPVVRGRVLGAYGAHLARIGLGRRVRSCGSRYAGVPVSKSRHPGTVGHPDQEREASTWRRAQATAITAAAAKAASAGT